MKFSELGLSPKVLAAVEAVGYDTPTPIQEQAIPHVLARRDVLGIAQTGTGKTAGFVLPMLTTLERGRARARMPRTLILEPTRELAAQVEESFNSYGANHKLTVALLIGGVSFVDQLKKLDRGADVLIATPGRLLDHFERGNLLMNGVEILVIDEADRMLDMGFIPDIERICKLLPFTRQTLFFSATMPPEIKRLADAFLSNAVRVEASAPSTAATTVTQLLVPSGRESVDKRAVLRKLIRDAKDLTNAIIFCNRKRDVAVVQRSLARHGFSVGALHGDMDQRSRMATLADFKANKLTLLVASDVAARGLDIPAVSHVFNFDVPTHAEDYIHRIGRTGRAGRKGTAITIATPLDRKYVAGIAKLTGQPIETLEVEADDELANARYAKRGQKPKTAETKDAPAEAQAPAKAGAPVEAEAPVETGKAVAPAAAPEKVAESDAKPAERSGSNQRSRGPRRPKGEPRPQRGKREREREPAREMETAFGSSEDVPQFLLRPVRTST
ncbi:DEAD/DEAH box helicase [Bauldia litoralis]|uniref:DEAD/DEAH box helicase n=1 Tax=Bauldia litoralis TaxID=665467 RepID=UPI003297B1C0